MDIAADSHASSALAIAAEPLIGPAAQALIATLNAELAARYPEPGATHFRLDPAEVAPGAGAFLVARVDGRPIGCGALRRLTDAAVVAELGTDVGELKRMFVAQEARGQGIGRALLAQLEAEARALGITRVVLETGTRQHEALALYRRAGYVDIPPYGEYVSSPGTSVCLGKPLGSTNAALLLIDVQQGLDEPRWGARNNPDAEQRIADLLAAWRAARRPVIHVQHLSLEPDSPLREDKPGHVFKAEALPIEGEPVFQKHVNSAFIGTDLETHLRDRGIDSLVIVGITTDHCVSSTTRMAGNLGFAVTVVEDATATFERRGPDGEHYSADLMHRAALASLHGEFATVRSARDVIASAGA